MGNNHGQKAWKKIKSPLTNESKRIKRKSQVTLDLAAGKAGGQISCPVQGMLIKGAAEPFLKIIGPVTGMGVSASCSQGHSDAQRKTGTAIRLYCWPKVATPRIDSRPP
jgi:hypothetical protein